MISYLKPNPQKSPPCLNITVSTPLKRSHNFILFFNWSKINRCSNSIYYATSCPNMSAQSPSGGKSFIMDCSSVDQETSKCKLCDHNYKVRWIGFTNLKTHIQSQHAVAYEYFQLSVSNKQRIDITKYKYPLKTFQIYTWIEYILMKLQPLSTLRCKFTQKKF